MTAVSNNACIMFQLELMLATFLHSSAEPRPWGRADLKGLEFGRDDWWSSVKRGSGHVAISPMFDHPMSRWNMPIQLNLRESDLQWKKSSVFFEIQQKNQKAIELDPSSQTWSKSNLGSFYWIHTRTYMFIIARRSKSNLGSFNCIHTRIRTCSSLQGDRSPILAHFIAYILVYVHVHHCKAIEVTIWLILLDTYSYVNVHHCKAIEVKSWLSFYCRHTRT